MIVVATLNIIAIIAMVFARRELDKAVRAIESASSSRVSLRANSLILSQLSTLERVGLSGYPNSP
jgi:hypothetical protein